MPYIDDEFIYSNPLMETYECDNQMSIFDFLKEEPNKTQEECTKSSVINPCPD